MEHFDAPPTFPMWISVSYVSTFSFGSPARTKAAVENCEFHEKQSGCAPVKTTATLPTRHASLSSTTGCLDMGASFRSGKATPQEIVGWTTIR